MNTVVVLVWLFFFFFAIAFPFQKKVFITHVPEEC